MNNKKFKELFNFSITKYFTNKWFAICNIIMLLGLIVGINFSSIQSIFKSKEDNIYTIHINDEKDYVSSILLEDFKDNESYKILVNDEYEYDAESIDKQDIILNISDDEEQVFKTEFVSKEGLNIDIVNPITTSLLKSRNLLFEEKYNLNKDMIELVQSDLKIDRKMLAVDSDNAQAKQLLILFAGAIPYFLYVLIFTRIASEVSQEKQSKASEYILTTVSAKEYLLSKVLSHAFILFIQGFLIIVYYLVSAGILGLTKVTTTDIDISSGMASSGISKEIVIYLFAVIFYNVLNIILLSIVQATLASRTSSNTEAGNSVSIITLLTSFLFIFTTTISPYQKISPVLHVLSIFPIFSRIFYANILYNKPGKYYYFYYFTDTTNMVDSNCL